MYINLGDSGGIWPLGVRTELVLAARELEDSLNRHL